MNTIITKITNAANGKSIKIHNAKEPDNPNCIKETYIWLPIIETLVSENVKSEIMQTGELHIHMEPKQIKRALKRLKLVKNSDGNKSNQEMFHQLWIELKPLSDSE